MFEVLIVIGLINLATVGVGAWFVRRVGQTLGQQVEQKSIELKAMVTNEFDLHQNLEFDLHRLGRLYVGKMLLEDRVLPALGYKEPKRSKFETRLLEGWRKAGCPPVAIDCGEFTSPEGK